MTASLNGNKIDLNRNFWRAEVTVTVVDANDGPLAGADVSGRWNSGSTVTNTTGSDGAATFLSGNLRRNVNSITFHLTEVVLTGYEYDYESSDTSITVHQNGSTSVQATQLDASAAPWQPSLPDRSPGGNSPALPDHFAGPAAASVPAASAVAEDDAFRVADSAEPLAAQSVPTLSRADAGSTGLLPDDLPITDPGAWPQYASAVDQLLALCW